MATMTHPEPIAVAPYVTASNLCMRLAKRLFDHAMTAGAILDPLDLAYEAWWSLRSAAERFVEDRSLELTEVQRAEIYGALAIAHEMAHPDRRDDPPFCKGCDCQTAVTICAIFQLLAGRPGRRRG